MPKKPGLPLTKRAVDAVKPQPGRTLKVAFEAPRGLLLVVYPSGRKAFALRYGEGSRRKLFMLGDHGALTVAGAQARAEKLRGDIADGKDPATEKAKRRATPTFQEWAAEYCVEASGRLAPRWVSETRRYLKAVPFGGKLVSAVTVEDVQRFYQAEREKGATTANRALAAVRACLSSAWRRSLVPENVARKVVMGRENSPRDRVLSDAESARLAKELESWPDPFVRAAFRLILETGARRSEVLRARWADVDLTEGVWRLPKTKSGRPQVIPLLSSTVALLKALPRVGEYIIPGRTPNVPRKTLHGPWRDICKAANLEGVTPHDLRRSYGLAVAKAAGILAASKLLRHSDVRVTARVYAPYNLEELREAAETADKAQRKALLKVVNGGGGKENPEG